MKHLTARYGHIENCCGGTLFFDEVGDMPLSAQVKLLRVLEEKEVTRLGSSGSIPVNVRELRNVMQRAVILAEGERIRSQDIVLY